MQKPFITTAIAAFGLLFIAALPASADIFSTRLSGRILLQVEEHGEAFYVAPDNCQRYYLGRPGDAFRIMSSLGLGITEKDYRAFTDSAPKRLWGRILLRVKARGEAYYVDATNGRFHYLGRPADAFRIMSELGLGISNRTLSEIPVAALSQAVPANKLAEAVNPAQSDDASPKPDVAGVELLKPEPEFAHERASKPASAPEPEPEPEPEPPVAQPPAAGLPDDPESEITAIESKVYELANKERVLSGLEELEWNQTAAGLAREHSQAMAAGEVGLGHSGFYDRTAVLRAELNTMAAAENVAYNLGAADPAAQAIKQWLGSSGHRRNLLGGYRYTGVGAAKAGENTYYFTQIFAE